MVTITHSTELLNSTFTRPVKRIRLIPFKQGEDLQDNESVAVSKHLFPQLGSRRTARGAWQKTYSSQVSPLPGALRLKPSP